jgi:D-sedoheptulose 7-phosphate isomerase
MRFLKACNGRFESAASIILFMLDLRIQQHFIDSADLQYQAAETLAKPLDAGVQALMACVTSGGKVLVCGEGSAAALAQYFASLFVGGFERERPELAAIALRHEGLGDPAYASLARQVRALGQAGDVLLLLTSTGEEEGLMRALHAAHERDMTVIALTGKGVVLLPKPCAKQMCMWAFRTIERRAFARFSNWPFTVCAMA